MKEMNRDKIRIYFFCEISFRTAMVLSIYLPNMKFFAELVQENGSWTKLYLVAFILMLAVHFVVGAIFSFSAMKVGVEVCLVSTAIVTLLGYLLTSVIGADGLSSEEIPNAVSDFFYSILYFFGAFGIGGFVNLVYRHYTLMFGSR